MISLHKNTPAPATPDITPLLDVVFILLIFFVVSAVFTARGLTMDLPEAQTAKPIAQKSLRIELLPDGKLLYDGQPATLLDISHKLTDAAALPVSRQPECIMLKSAPNVRVKRFVGMVDMVRRHGFNNLVIATAARQPEPAHKAAQ
ncbi:ExbD/TolR family protein [Pseudodesulfovibrio senegalensis]|uniref:Biopolymer transporter ExbD n=1 Tax=Pseudodesulfovibrio senegalensis TaxID=1721087 RepID=A0A6N6MZM4_9BACT|nr:biopolymer transporter ExbD [Pseudodesulfovibrio senegalensis]KAB1440267.1 biopolymer transporter ExbD [Pseudodesulfovibrio senegalensis]